MQEIQHFYGYVCYAVLNLVLTDPDPDLDLDGSISFSYASFKL